MKHSLCALASGLALAFAGTAAFAGSTGNTYQNGFNNDAEITQAYNGNTTATITQIEMSNVAKANQSNNFFGSAQIDIYQKGYEQLRQRETVRQRGRQFQGRAKGLAERGQHGPEPQRERPVGCLSGRREQFG